MQRKSAERLAVISLLGGAIGIGFAPILVRLSEVGPSATAFYRLAFALPLLSLAALLESPPPPTALVPQPHGATAARLHARTSPSWLCVLAGFLFAGDLAFWHWSVKLTSVANSTLLTNCAPFFVMLGARLIFSERITVFLVLGMGLASIGAVLLVGTSLQLNPQHLRGDILAFITAIFYGGYLLTIKYLRLSFSTARTLAWSGIVSCGLLLGIALCSHESIRITSPRGWLVVAALGLVSHIGGQGLIAYALAHLPAGFSSVGLLVQPVVAALLAWILLAEPMSAWQVLGGIVVLIGIAMAGRSRSATVLHEAGADTVCE